MKRTPVPVIFDDFRGINSLAVSLHTPRFTVGNAWTQVASDAFYLQSSTLQPNRYTDGDLAIIDCGLSDFSLSSKVTPYDSGDNSGFPALVFRYIDNNNFWYAQPDANTGEFDVYSVIAGSHVRQLTYSVTVTSGVEYLLRIDCKGNNITLYVNGIEIVTCVNTFNNTATKVGVRVGIGGTPAVRVTWRDFKVVPFYELSFNWPLFTEYASNPIVSLGASGAYDDTDCNAPAVEYDSANSRWVLCYSAYSGSGTQKAALAYSTSLPGTWTKEAGNPVFDSEAIPYGEDGGLAFFKGKFYHSFEIGGFNSVGIATSTDLINWTNLGAVLPGDVAGWDLTSCDGSSLRVSQDGNTLQLWYQGANATYSNGIGYVTSTNGTTWTIPAHGQFIITNATPYLLTQLHEPHVYVPTGKEGTECLLTFDAPGRIDGDARILSQYLSVDGMTTWHQRYNALSGSGSGWNEIQVFDAHIIVNNEIMYMFHAGADTPGATININSEIGVATAPFPFTSLKD